MVGFMTYDSRPVDQRRFALLVYIRRFTPTMDKIIAMPVYQGINPAHVRRYVERDLQDLRENGYQISVDPMERYVLDDSTNIKVDGSGVELGILQSLLASKAKTTPFVVAQHGVTKLLSSGSVTSEAAGVTIHTPRGEEAVRIAAAIQLGKRIQFTYQSASSSEPALYTVEPFRLEVHYDVFYLRGYQVEVEGRSSRGHRVYKLDRIIGTVSMLDDDVSRRLDEVPTDLSPISATVRLTRPLPLLAQATRVKHHENGIDIELANIDRSDLYSTLMFYGLEAELLGPQDVRADFESRVRHLAALDTGGEESHG